MKRFLLIAAAAALLLPAASSRAADVILQGDEFNLFIRETDGLQLVEFAGSIASRTDTAGLVCNVDASAVALAGDPDFVQRYVAMLLVSQTADIPVRIFIDSKFESGLCTIDTIRMGKRPL